MGSSVSGIDNNIFSSAELSLEFFDDLSLELLFSFLSFFSFSDFGVFSLFGLLSDFCFSDFISDDEDLDFDFSLSFDSLSLSLDSFFDIRTQNMAIIYFTTALYR